MAPLPIFKVSSIASSLLSDLCFHPSLFFLTLTLLSPSYKAPGDSLGPTMTILDNLPISRALTDSHPKSICHVSECICRLGELECGHLRKVVVQATTGSKINFLLLYFVTGWQAQL